jgi:hypothetical protein
MQKKIVITAVAVILIVVSLTGVFWAGTLPQTPQEATNRFTYPISVDNKTYTVTLEANWDAQTPTVALTNSSDRHALELYFLGGTKKTVTYTIIIPTGLIGGNISLIKKYYLQSPDSYILRNDGAYNSLKMTFDYDPNFSGIGYFEIIGTQGA